LFFWGSSFFFFDNGKDFIKQGTKHKACKDPRGIQRSNNTLKVLAIKPITGHNYTTLSRKNKKKPRPKAASAEEKISKITSPYRS
jgi:hypothetical protein